MNSIQNSPDNQRAYYIDRLRLILSLLVFFEYSAIGFGGSGFWYYRTNQPIRGFPHDLLTLIMDVNQSFFMSFFFFISALLLPASLEKKGIKNYLKDRAKRLLLPLLVYSFIFHPLLVLWTDKQWYVCGLGPMWFVFSLILFESSYLLYVKSFKGGIPIPWRKVSFSGLLRFVFAAGIAAFILRLFFPINKIFFGLPLGYFSLYVFMYAGGIMASRNGWMEKFNLREAFPWFFSAVFIGIPTFLSFFNEFSNTPQSFFGGWNFPALFYSLWEPVFCVGIGSFLFAWIKLKKNRYNTVIAILAADSYASYIIHPFFIVSCTLLSEKMPFPPLLRFCFVLILGLPTCLLSAHYIRLESKQAGIGKFVKL